MRTCRAATVRCARGGWVGAVRLLCPSMPRPSRVRRPFRRRRTRARRPRSRTRFGNSLERDSGRETSQRAVALSRAACFLKIPTHDLVRSLERVCALGKGPQSDHLLCAGNTGVRRERNRRRRRHGAHAARHLHRQLLRVQPNRTLRPRVLAASRRSAPDPVSRGPERLSGPRQGSAVCPQATVRSD